jgi:NitT/TauT family transport system ATP-binding protein
MSAVESSRERPLSLEVIGVVHRYAGEAQSLLAIDGVDLHIAEGEFVSLVGPSGCGKSTLLRAAAGLLTPRAGEVSVLGGTAERAAAQHELGLVTQEPGLLPWRTVAANVGLALRITGRRGAIREQVEELLHRVGMERFADYYPRQLSGGMRQRVALARALAHGPRLLLMDEPFGALDELSREELRVELLRIWERDRISVLFVTHSIREAVLLSDRVLVMSPAPGRIVADVGIELPRPRTEVLEETAEFIRHVADIRVALGRRAAMGVGS